MKINTFIKLLAVVPMLFVGCQKDIQQAPPQLQLDESHYYKPSDSYLRALDALTIPPTDISSRSSCHWTELAAGSNNALAAAITNACAGGVIYLKNGVHTETNPITITKSIIIIGEAGAVLKVNTQLSHLNANGNYRINPFIHFLNAPRSAVLDLNIQPIGTNGSTAILFENSHESGVIRSKFTGFQSAVILENSDRIAIMRNTIVGTSAWKTDPNLQAQSIIIMNGLSAYVSDNDISNSAVGIWPCSKWGTCERNYTHGDFIGIILCNVPKFAILPNGQITGSLSPATSWKIRNNLSTDNFNIGYIVADGSNHNLLENNDAARNAVYDMELLTDSYRFGFLTPFVYNNVVNAGAYPYIRIKDCGRNSTIIGGIRVNTVTDPCN